MIMCKDVLYFGNILYVYVFVRGRFCNLGFLKLIFVKKEKF